MGEMNKRKEKYLSVKSSQVFSYGVAFHFALNVKLYVL